MIELLQIPIDQIGTFWPVMSKVVARALPPGVNPTPKAGMILLEKLLSGQMQAWSLLEREDGGETDIIGYMVTQLTDEEVLGRRSVLIYALAANEEAEAIASAQWKRAYASLVAYARAQGAGCITAYTANERMLRLVDALGGSSEYRFVVLDL